MHGGLDVLVYHFSTYRPSVLFHGALFLAIFFYIITLKVFLLSEWAVLNKYLYILLYGGILYDYFPPVDA